MQPEFIVAIGGSAGFLKPLLTFFDHTPEDNVCYVILRHIAPDTVSHLEEILRRHSALKITTITDGMKMEANAVCILPSGFYAIAADQKFWLIKRNGYPNCAVDIFMNSLAKEYKQNAIGIIMSGNGANGSEGIVSIKQHGGKVLIQQPATCEFPYMPGNAIKTGCYDQVLPADEMPGEIRRICNLTKV